MKRTPTCLRPSRRAGAGGVRVVVQNDSLCAGAAANDNHPDSPHRTLHRSSMERRHVLQVRRTAAVPLPRAQPRQRYHIALCFAQRSPNSMHDPVSRRAGDEHKPTTVVPGCRFRRPPPSVRCLLLRPKQACEICPGRNDRMTKGDMRGNGQRNT
jgi:hypothetical protein